MLKPNDSMEIYSDPAMYDRESDFTTDVPFYLGLAAETGGPVLELACGTGRVTIPLAQAGYEVSGLDISPPMIERAREKARASGLEIDFRVADCRQFDLGRRFKLIIMPFNAIAHIHDRPSHEAMFSRIREHLEPDGIFSFAWFNPNEKYLYRDPTQRYPTMKFNLTDGTPVTVTENNVYDKATQINHVKWYYQIGDRPEFMRELNMRQLYPAELEALVHHNGFELAARYGDYQKSPFQSSSVHQVCVCRVTR